MGKSIYGAADLMSSLEADHRDHLAHSASSKLDWGAIDACLVPYESEHDREESAVALYEQETGELRDAGGASGSV